jgi:hypothetical protein
MRVCGWRPRCVGEVLCAHLGNNRNGDWGGGARVRMVMLRYAVAGADGGGGLCWSELMIEAACGPHIHCLWLLITERAASVVVKTVTPSSLRGPVLSMKHTYAIGKNGSCSELSATFADPFLGEVGSQLIDFLLNRNKQSSELTHRTKTQEDGQTDLCSYEISTPGLTNFSQTLNPKHLSYTFRRVLPRCQVLERVAPAAGSPRAAMCRSRAWRHGQRLGIQVSAACRPRNFVHSYKELA